MAEANANPRAPIADGAASTYLGPIDPIRGIAAVGVLLHHIFSVWQFPGFHAFDPNSGMALITFFLLSGFVISYVYGENIKDRNGAARFFTLRLGRIYSIHFVFVGVWIVYGAALFFTGHIEDDSSRFFGKMASDAFRHLTLTYGLNFHFELSLNYPAWTLATEFAAYILFVGIVITRVGRKLLTFISLGIVLACFLAVELLRIDDLHLLTPYGLLCTFFGFFTGVVACEVFKAVRPNLASIQRSVAVTLLHILLIGGLVVYMANGVHGMNQFDMLIWGSMIIVLLAATPDNPITRLFSIRPLVWLGHYSLSIYMVHAIVIDIFDRVITSTGMLVNPEIRFGGMLVPHSDGLTRLLLALACVAIVFALGALSFHLVEDPARRKSRDLAKKWFPKAAAPKFPEVQEPANVNRGEDREAASAGFRRADHPRSA